jgi:hypothetical protein
MSAMTEKEKRDWALLHQRLPQWQEDYMDKLIQEYIALLQGEGAPSQRFWALDQRIRQDKRSAGVQVRMRPSGMQFCLSGLLADGAITADDLEGFSEELRERVCAETQFFAEAEDAAHSKE